MAKTLVSKPKVVAIITPTGSVKVRRTTPLIVAKMQHPG
ncbi:hypothetical protein F4553_000721 [Allocatelliglobosispora scoriae]|uniref:Uncharacterized protein n=1 Tax=Allocatelliglobosispora scoriae TaxID=643052 RepID=A0A841BKR1_9ACTN|nr:hypothetical protein [Allocatelliglobosispora scoriae]